MSKIMTTLFGGLIAYGGFTVITNTSSMNKTVNMAVSLLKNKYELKEVDVGEFKKIVLKKILPFYTKLYTIKNLGTLSVLTLNIGIMNVITLNLNSFCKDLPYISLNFIFMLNKRKIVFEIYDFMINKEDEKYKNFLKEIKEINEKNSNLKEATVRLSWNESFLSGIIHKRGNVMNDNQILTIMKEVIEAYIKYAEKVSELSDEDVKKKINYYKEFTDNLTKKGGVAINSFREGIGEEKTYEFLSKTFYGFSNFQK
jgi:hypothetical protein